MKTDYTNKPFKEDGSIQVELAPVSINALIVTGGGIGTFAVTKANRRSLLTLTTALTMGP